MKLLSFEIGGRTRVGALAGDGVVDLTEQCGSLRDALGRRLEVKAKPDYGLAEIAFLPPIPYPEKIICVGVNYGNRNAEYKDNSELAKYPSIFVRFPGSLVGHRRPIVRPPESAQLDYEGEIAIVIGKGGRRIAEQDADRHIAGLTCANEGTIRDWTRHGKFNVTQGKSWEASGAIGPWLVTADEFRGFDNIQLTTRVNGEVRQDDNTTNLMFPFRSLIRYISTWTALTPGDVIITGTPVGAGIRFTPPKFLKAGDVVEVQVEGVGTLSNTVADES
ncbi:MAG: FAA hydrolase family protein [Betaproteobacteria bacterium]|nr:FAA hydrolase family protein [Betaproteobacteria bacterium]